MQLNKILILMGAALILSFACDHIFNKTVGSGNIITEKREINPEFDTVVVGNHGHLHIGFGPAVSLEISGDDNIVPHLISEVRNGKLFFESGKKLRGGFKSKKGVQYHLTVPKSQLNRFFSSSHGNIYIPEIVKKNPRIKLSSHGDIFIKKIDCRKLDLVLTSHGKAEIAALNADALNVKMSSHGKVEIESGTLKTQQLNLSSHGKYYAEGLKSDRCELRMTSHGRVKVYATKKINGRISSHGVLYYRGDPELNVSKSRHARIKRL